MLPEIKPTFRRLLNSKTSLERNVVYTACNDIFNSIDSKCINENLSISYCYYHDSCYGEGNKVVKIIQTFKRLWIDQPREELLRNYIVFNVVIRFRKSPNRLEFLEFDIQIVESPAINNAPEPFFRFRHCKVNPRISSKLKQVLISIAEDHYIDSDETMEKFPWQQILRNKLNRVYQNFELVGKFGLKIYSRVVTVSSKLVLYPFIKIKLIREAYSQELWVKEFYQSWEELNLSTKEIIILKNNFSAKNFNLIRDFQLLVGFIICKFVFMLMRYLCLVRFLRCHNEFLKAKINSKILSFVSTNRMEKFICKQIKEVFLNYNDRNRIYIKSMTIIRKTPIGNYFGHAWVKNIWRNLVVEYSGRRGIKIKIIENFEKSEDRMDFVEFYSEQRIKKVLSALGIKVQIFAPYWTEKEFDARWNLRFAILKKMEEIDERKMLLRI